MTISSHDAVVYAVWQSHELCPISNISTRICIYTAHKMSMNASTSAEFVAHIKLGGRYLQNQTSYAVDDFISHGPVLQINTFDCMHTWVTARLSLRNDRVTATSRKPRRDAKHYDVRCGGWVRQGCVADRPMKCRHFMRVWFVTCMISYAYDFIRVWFVTCIISYAYDLKKYSCIKRYALQIVHVKNLTRCKSNTLLSLYVIQATHI